MIGRMSGIRVRPSWKPLAVTVLTALALSGCGLPTELERELDPEGRPPPPTQRHTPAPAPPGGPPTPAPTASGPATPSDPAARDADQPCPAGGVRLRAEFAAAAMGLRAMTLTLTNCGEKPYVLDGYPVIRVLGEDGAPLPGVRAVRGLDDVFQAPPAADPTAFTLAPRQSAVADLMWRVNTEPSTALHVTARPGAPRVTVTPDEHLDVGPRNVVGTSPWRPR
ncbi:Protein of unknown function [Streptomyces sp. AmelKG-E11A]|nr:Protein of unknown function [Streptomyces sp. AmelKG-E11A]